MGHHELAGLPDGAGLVLMDPAEVPNQLEPRRRAARDHQPAFRRGRGRCVEKADTLRSIRNFVVLVSTAAAARAVGTAAAGTAAERAAAERAVATAAAARAGEGSVAGWVEAVGTAARVGVGLAVAATAGAAMAGHN